jgi:hypothetical protein
VSRQYREDLGGRLHLGDEPRADGAPTERLDAAGAYAALCERLGTAPRPRTDSGAAYAAMVERNREANENRRRPRGSGE